MGCCVRTQEKIVINSLSIPILNKDSLEIKNVDNFEKNQKIIKETDQKPKRRSDKTSALLNEKENDKTQKKNIKTMNILKEISYNEVCQSTKYFLN